ncbi:MAG: chromosome segregation protein SMC [Rhodospirillaceae bacterium]|nr:chromosome segregation protein SMC [Rhodospirillaceae bacterium]
MLQFNKLRLSGFKSFVDNTELRIELGLTGVVGPNGCGKSNLVEALRWAMGETSAKQMRGQGMEDVIFGGTSTRPPRNVAEVVLSLDNEERTAPALFNDEGELDVSRRIEREKGSTYRVNGKEVRARDVQLLFADSATGARSTALVSQGRIGAVINAKPQQRRGLLEEAAGITGLHSRRHEAELRLRGAETNLERLDDILITLDAQLAGLKKQARQATRYNNLSDHIRKAEATMFHLLWRDAEAALAQAEEQLRKTDAEVGELTGLTATATTRQTAAAEVLPALRQSEAEAAAELHRMTVARENLEAEERRIQDAVDATRSRLNQVSTDTERAKEFASDARAQTERLEAERGEIEDARATEREDREAASAELKTASDAVSESEASLDTLTAKVAEIEARRGGLANQIAELEARLSRLSARAGEIDRQKQALEADQPESETVADAERTMARKLSALEAARTDLERAETSRSEAEDAVRGQAGGLQDAQSEFTRLKAEEQAISKLLSAVEDDLWPPLIDALEVSPGFEAALGAALGEDLNVPADEAAPSHWRTLAPLSASFALPEGAKPLSDVVNAPPALTRRLHQIGVVDTVEEGRALAGGLAQGQRLVSRDGGLWRWDGFTVSSEATTPAAARLEQRNRLAEVRGEMGDAETALHRAEATRDKARQTEQEARAAEQAARSSVAAADRELTDSRDILAREKEKATLHASKLTALADALQTAATDIEETERDLGARKTELATLPDPVAEREQITALRATLAEHRTEHVNCRSRHDQIERQARDRADRLQAIAMEAQSWQRRGEETAGQLDELKERGEQLNAELARLAERPKELEAEKQKLLDAVSASEAKRGDAGDALAKAETALRDADQILRDAEATLAQAREQRVRAEGAVEQSKQSCTSIAERVTDRLACRPADLFEQSGLNPEKELPELEATERKVERLQRERETMGPVNLRAEQEATELTEQIEGLTTEREDLITAIDKLRHGISELNREGRARLVASFKEVDKHFQALFVRLFGGGQAHLALTESDDPLEAGLEIMASPPGKKLQVLSLLSGGEQALTALALLFGVFLTNPAPICVLDEVDAPLDDANVDRFCTLLEEMSKEERTRFLIITHHRMTMARMDRLFGVTMSERGVSQLVSVDLQRAVELRDIA